MPNRFRHLLNRAATLLTTLLIITSSSLYSADAGSTPDASNVIKAPENQQFSAIQHINTNQSGGPDGTNVNAIVGADTFYSNGFTGQSTTTANVEAGHVWDGHETLGHVTLFENDTGAWDTDSNPSTPDYDRHATWVGQIIGGRGSGNLRVGISSNTDLRSGAIATSYVSPAHALGFMLNLDSFVDPHEAFFGAPVGGSPSGTGVDVVNSSWGFTDTDGNDYVTAFVDSLIDENIYTTHVRSAGNTGPDTNTVGGAASGYNSISVGALQNDGNNGYNSIASFSSRSPSDFAGYDINDDPETIAGVRAAVDITAPGTNLIAAFYGGQTGGNNPTLAGSSANNSTTSYSSGIAGTSFSSPIVAGGAALVYSASYNTPALASNANSRDARVVKAVLLNGADKVPNWDNGQTANAMSGEDTTQSLDWTYGAGALNLDRTYQNYVGNTTKDVAGVIGGSVEAIGWDYGEVNTSGTNTYVITEKLMAGSTLTATLTWFRDLSFSNANNLFSTNVIDNAQSDLNLRIRNITSGAVWNSRSLYNVVEHLHFDVVADGFYEIDVIHNGMTFDFVNTTSEEYGLAWLGTAIVPVPEPASISLLMTAGLFAMRYSRRPGGPRRGVSGR